MRREGIYFSSRIGDLSSTLNYLCIAANKNFSSELPKELGKCTNLQYINLSENEFYGKIPIELKNCKRMMFLNMNHFSKLDWEWFTDEDILIFPDMRENNFSGEVPKKVLESDFWEKRRNYIYPFNQGYGFSNVDDYS